MVFKRRRTAANKEPPGGGNDCTEAVRKPKKARTGAVRGLYDNVREVYGEQAAVQETVRSWVESFPEVEKFDRHRPLKWVVCCGAVASAVWSVYAGRPLRSSLFLLILTAAALVGFDVLGLFSRMLADLSRILVTVAILSWAWVVVLPVKESLIISGTITAAVLVLVATMNLKWLAAQVYKRSPTVQKALEKTQSAPMEDLWSLTVHRMIRTLLWELGIKVDSPIWWEALKGAWVIGYGMAAKVTASTISQVDALRARVADLEDDLAERDAVIDANIEFFEEHETYVKEITGLRAALEDAQTNTRKAKDEARENFKQVIQCEEYIHTLEATIEKQKNELADLSAQQEKLMQEKGPVPVVTEEERQEQLLWAALNEGMGVARMAKYAGVTHHRAQVFAAEHRAEHDAAKAKVAAAKEAVAV